MPLVGCGQTYSYVCNGRACLASFEGPGEQDLSDAGGPTVEVVTIDDGPSVTVRVDGKNAQLVKGKRRRLEGYVLTLTKLEGENVTLRIVPE